MSDILIVSSQESPDVIEIIERGVLGPPGDTGQTGVGIPSGGSIGQFVAKRSDTNYDMEWIDAPYTDRLVKGAYQAILGSDGTLNLPIDANGSSTLASTTTIHIKSGSETLAFDNTGHLDVPGTVTHQGLAPSEGVNIDQILTFTKSLTVDNTWQDVGISHLDLTTGTYLVQLYANDLQAGGSSNNEYYSGILSWFDGLTNSTLELPTDEIVLHRAGISGNASLFLRTYATASGSQDGLKLQIYSNSINSSAANYVFKFRRII